MRQDSEFAQRREGAMNHALRLAVYQTGDESDEEGLSDTIAWLSGYGHPASPSGASGLENRPWARRSGIRG